MNDLIPRATIYEIEAARHKSIALYAETFDTLQTAHKATPPGAMGSLPFLGFSGESNYGPPDREGFVTRVTKSIDRGIWNHLILATNLDKLMDKTERDAFRDQCEKDPPPATADNCLATMERLIGDRDLIFKRGIANAFSKLDRRFRSHDGFKVGSRMVLSHMFGVDGWWNHYQRHDETLLDIERAFAILDGLAPPERDGGIVGALKLAKGSRFAAQTYSASSPYFRVNVFKNGNAHVWFERADLVEKVNLLLADYYGATLGVGADAAERHHAPATGLAKNFGFFETPPEVTYRLFEHARVPVGAPVRTALSILEPSAGRGALARPMLDAGHHVTCVDVQATLCDGLRGLPGYKRVIHGDFIDLNPDVVDKFDAIVMNPPFDGQRDIDHVVHAARFLKPGGRLAAVMSAGVEFRTNAKAVDFRAMVERRGGRFFDLPPGSFQAAGTMVNTCIVTFGV